MIVTKFGGSSVASANQFKKVKEIVTSDFKRQIVVSSACGKRHSDDYKLTDLLYLMHAHLQYSVNCDHLFEVIKERFLEIKRELKVDLDIESELVIFFHNLTKETSIDYLVSRGEYFTAKLLAAYLDYDFYDAKDLIFFDYDKSIDFTSSTVAIKAALAKSQRLVVPGFYGSFKDGKIKVMERGGSDITGSILARCLKAEIYENWTDVSGILMADPRVVKNPKGIKTITYNELRELSFMGASVIHEDAIEPLKEVGIPIVIKNTNQPLNSGTRIVEKVSEEVEDNIVTGISGKKNYSVFTIYAHDASNKVGLLRKVLDVFENYEIPIQHVPVSIDTFSLVVPTAKVENKVYEIISKIKAKIDIVNIKVEDGLSLVAIVGRNLANHVGASGSLFQTLGENGINIKMISQGSDEINIIIGVKNKDFDKAIRAIYSTFS